MAVTPKRAGLSGQGQAGDAFGKLLVVEMPLENIGIHVGLLDQIAADIVIGNTGGLTQQILDVHRPVRRFELEDFGTAFRFGFVADLNLGKGRNVFRNRIGQRQLSLFDQHHRRQVGNRLCHRMKCKDGVRRHRPLGGDVTNAEAFEIDRPAMLLDQHDHAGKLSGRDFILEKFSQALQLGS